MTKYTVFPGGSLDVYEEGDEDFDGAQIFDSLDRAKRDSIAQLEFLLSQVKELTEESFE